MEKTYRYTTLKGLVNKNRQFSLSNFLNKRMYHINKGWGKFKLSDELDKEIKYLFNSFLGIDINFYVSNCGLFERLIIDKRKVKYIAGQDYGSEIRYLKKLLRS